MIDVFHLINLECSLTLLQNETSLQDFVIYDGVYNTDKKFSLIFYQEAFIYRLTFL
jgi:hypothetical protein